MNSNIDIDSATLRCNLHFASRKTANTIIMWSELEQKFCVNLVRNESGSGTVDDPLRYGPPVCMFGAFKKDESRMDFAMALAFNGRTEIGANPRLLAISGRPYINMTDLSVDFLAVMKFLIDSNLLHMVDFAEVQERVGRHVLCGKDAVERFNQINAKSGRVIASYIRGKRK